MSRQRRRAAVLAAAALLAACSHDSNTTATVTPCASGSLVQLDTMQVVTVPAASANCIDMEGGTGRYVIVPQFAVVAPDTTPNQFQIGALGAASADRVASERVVETELGGAAWKGARPLTTAQRFDHRRHAIGKALAAQVAADPALRARAMERASLPPVAKDFDSVRVFAVCGDLNCSSFKQDTAVLEFTGTNIVIYQSKDAPAAPGGFTTAEMAAFGSVFDQTLYPIDANAFAPPSDIDGNGHEIVLISPKVNSLVTNAECQSSGYVAGFFFPDDLIPGSPGSNSGEIYYSLAPDPSGHFSCAHTKDDVESITGGTFLHETLHMINFSEKVLVHGLGDTEEEWLDEGMAHIAEEMGSLHYEALYPPPSGRTNPNQLFPDSAEGYISGDLFNFYSFLLSPNTNTVTIQIENGSSLGDSGGEWLFLRWLGDQMGSPIYGNIVRSALTGQSNLETQAGEPLATLLGEASLAFYSDSLLGVPRTEIAPAYRYTSRNLRQLGQALFNAEGGPTPDFPRAFPIAPSPLTFGVTQHSAMYRGTMAYYTYDSNGGAARLHFAAGNGGSFATGLGAQVTVLRCGAAVTACQ